MFKRGLTSKHWGNTWNGHGWTWMDLIFDDIDDGWFMADESFFLGGFLKGII